jgi:transposase
VSCSQGHPNQAIAAAAGVLQRQRVRARCRASSASSARRARRARSAPYKAGILAEYEKAGRGEQGALLRREGLYSSHIDAWRKLSEAGVLTGLAPTKRGRKPKVINPLGRENAELRRALARSEHKLKRAEAIIEIQKKVAQVLKDLDAETPESDETK